MSMQLSMSLSYGYECRLKLSVNDGACQTIFPALEKLLNSSTDFQKAVAAAIPRKRMELYRSVIDCICSETFTHVQPLCFAYYKGTGRLLKYDLTEKQRAAMEAFMLRVVAAAYLAWMTEQEVVWKRLVNQVTNNH